MTEKERKTEEQTNRDWITEVLVLIACGVSLDSAMQRP